MPMVSKVVMLVFAVSRQRTPASGGVVDGGAVVCDGDADLAEDEGFCEVGANVITALAKEINAISSISPIRVIHNCVERPRIAGEHRGVVNACGGFFCPAEDVVDNSLVTCGRIIHLRHPGADVHDVAPWTPCFEYKGPEFSAVEICA